MTKSDMWCKWWQERPQTESPKFKGSCETPRFMEEWVREPSGGGKLLRHSLLFPLLFSSLFYPAFPTSISPRATVRFMSQSCGSYTPSLTDTKTNVWKMSRYYLSSFTIMFFFSLFHLSVALGFGAKMKTQNAGEGRVGTGRTSLYKIQR